MLTIKDAISLTDRNDKIDQHLMIWIYELRMHLTGLHR